MPPKTKYAIINHAMAAERVKRKNEKNKNLLKEEKAIFLLLTVIGVLGIVFGFKSFGASLSRPFEVQLAGYEGEKFFTLSEKETAEVERQKITDSDSDGLMDYDELYVYKTSPYLSDSDSDNFDDKTEIFSDHNPNCPEGRDCNTSSLTAVEETAKPQSSDLLSQLLGMNSGAVSELTFDSTGDITDYFLQMSSEQLRSLLITQGVPKEAVDQMSDEEITELLQATLAEAEISGEFDSLVNSGETVESVSESAEAIAE